MFSIESSGSFNGTRAFLDNIINGNPYSVLEKYGQEGVAALAAATPRESGLSASSWGYEIVNDGSAVTIYWTNTNTVNGFHVVIGLQYGHATGTGGWVQGYDFINPAIQPVMDKIAENVWKEVVS